MVAVVARLTLVDRQNLKACTGPTHTRIHPTPKAHRRSPNKENRKVALCSRGVCVPPGKRRASGRATSRTRKRPFVHRADIPHRCVSIGNDSSLSLMEDGLFLPGFSRSRCIRAHTQGLCLTAVWPAEAESPTQNHHLHRPYRHD